MKRETRATVGLIVPRSRPRIPEEEGCTGHWNGNAPLRLAGKPHTECRRSWRNVQRFHMGRYYTPNPLPSGRHWSDIAYTFAVCHHGIAMDGRGKGVRTAANGTNAGNNSWYACFFMVGGDEEPSAEMLQAAEWYARTVLGVTRWNEHNDHKPTGCPGTVSKYISGGRIHVGDIEPPKLGDRILSLQDPMLRGEDVRELQTLLNRWEPGIAGNPDGVFGPTTRDASAAFMRRYMNVRTDNPQVGPKTIAALREALTPVPAPEEKPTVAGFTDVPEDHTHAEGIEKVAKAGLLDGYSDNTFRPDAPVTRGQLATVLSRLIKE